MKVLSTLVRLPVRFLAFLMSAMGRVLNRTHYPGAGGSFDTETRSRRRPKSRR